MVKQTDVRESFRRVKSDVVKLQKQVIELNQTQKRLLEKIAKLENKKVGGVKKPAKQVVVKTVTARKKTEYIATKGGDKFHDVHCPFAKNINKENKVVYKTKMKALLAGHKPCKCV